MLQTDVRSILAIAMITISRPGVFECKIAAANFRGLLGANRTEGTLYQQEFDGSTGLTDSGSFLFPGAIIVLWCMPSRGAKMFRGWKHRHIHRRSSVKMLHGTESSLLMLERVSSTHSNSVQRKSGPVHLRVLCSAPTSSSIF